MNIEQLEQHLNIDANAYTETSLAALNYYMQRFMFTVPFENIDVQNGVAISVNLETIYNKVVNHKRGGFVMNLTVCSKHILKLKGLSYTWFLQRFISLGRKKFRRLTRFTHCNN